MIKSFLNNKTFCRFIRFGLVGASGVIVDMAVFYLFADHKMLGCGITFSKIIAAETALVNNFLWNDVWTFRDISAQQRGNAKRLQRFIKFNLICLVGIALSVLILQGQVHFLHVEIYVANLVAIFVASLWNFWMNLKFGWTEAKPQKP